MFDAASDHADTKAFAERCEADRHHFRLTVSPEDAGQMADLRAFTRELMWDAERDLGTRLDWVAVDHWNTDKPHIHVLVLVLGRADDGRDLVISRHYISQGFRSRAAERVTLELGPRSEQEIRASLEREVDAERWTSLDRSLRDISDEGQASRYQTLAKDGFGSVQDAQQYTSQLNQQEAAAESAVEVLNLAERQVASLKAQRVSAEASLAQANAQLRQAQVNLERTRIVAPVDGYVTNLLAQLGDYLNVGVNAVSVVDANSFWVDAYFEETNLAPIRVGDQAKIKLIGYSQTLRGHVDSIARAINVPNAQPNGQGVANVNPIFTWVRLAQRIPVRVHIDEAPPGVVLAAGMTATVEIDDPTRGRTGALHFSELGSLLTQLRTASLPDDRQLAEGVPDHPKAERRWSLE